MFSEIRQNLRSAVPGTATLIGIVIIAVCAAASALAFLLLNLDYAFGRTLAFWSMGGLVLGVVAAGSGIALMLHNEQ